MPRRLLHIFLPAVTGALLIGLWYAICFSLSDDRKFLLPTPDKIVAAFRENGPELLRSAANTAQGALLGFGLALVFSTTMALLLSLSSLVRASLYPYLMAMQLTPTPVLAPICVIWVGAGIKSVALLTFLIAFFPLVVNTTQGLISTDRNLVELFRMWRASRWQQLFHLRVPAALPYFFVGLRIAATLAPIGAVVADMNAGSSANDGDGLGFRALVFSSQAQYPALFATAATTCVLGFVFTAGILAVSWFFLHEWHDSYERADK
jgi:NitT/TauT family transport system permease protein